jgi:CSLREA domain-containing protein
MLRPLVLGCALALLAASPARAADFAVNSLEDHAPDDCATECTLRDAVTLANGTPAADTITLPAGTIALSSGLTITQPVTIAGAPEGTTLDPDYSDRILEVSASTTVSRVTLTRGQSPDSLGGAALLQHGGTVTLDRVVVDAMSTNHAGGALLQQSGSLTITDSEVRTSHGFSGGGLYAAAGSTTVDRTLWLANDGSTGGGGAIYNGGATLTVTNSTFAGNSASSAHGGAIYAGAGSTTVRNVTFEANVASGNNGGGSAIWSDAAVTTSNVLFGETGYQDSCAGVALNEQGGSVDAGASCAGASHNRPVRLGPLVSNGGLTRSLEPWADSAGIDEGDNASCPGLDQRGATRAHDAADPCDAGAVEGAAAVAAPPPVVAAVSMTPGARAARFDATIDRQGLATGYEIEYGTTTAYGATLPDTVPFGPGAGAQPVSVQLGGLEPATTYHYRVVATSAGGTVEGPDRTFTTLAADQIAITAAPAAFVTAPSVAFQFAPTVGVDGLECVLTGPGQSGDPAFCADAISYDLTDDGAYTFTVRAQDGSASATRSFTLDRVAPAAPVITGAGALLTGTAEPFAQLEILDGGAHAGAATAGADGTWSFPIPAGAHTYTVRATDAAGNVSPASAPRFVGGVTPQPTPTPSPTPTPTPPGDVVARPVRGKVLIKRPGGKGYVELDSTQGIPSGSTIDTRKGTVSLTARGGTATFHDGIFKLTLTRTTTDLTLTEPLAKCPKRGAAHAAAKKKPRTRKLWGKGSGSFRTRGQYSAATVRGTEWLVQDSCSGTLTRVRKGVVAVRDNVKRRTIVLRAGKKYLARPRR